MGAEDSMNYAVNKLKEWIVVLQNFGGSLIAKVDETFPSETRAEQLTHWVEVAKPFTIAGVVLIVCAGCCRRYCSGRWAVKMMKAPRKNPKQKSNLRLKGWNPPMTCSEMVMPIGRGRNDTMFPAAPFNLKDFINDCKSFYGVPPRPHWITTYYGGHDIKLVLQRFASNIIFSNGLRDPYSSGGVLEDLSDSLLAVYTANGSHCLDILSAQQSDPQWLIMQRKMEVKIIDGWIKKYYADLSNKR